MNNKIKIFIIIPVIIVIFALTTLSDTPFEMNTTKFSSPTYGIDMDSLPSITVTGTISHWQAIDGPSFAIVPEHKISVPTDNGKIYLYGKLILDQSLDGQERTITGKIIENYAEYRESQFGSSLGGDPSTSVIFVNEVQLESDTKSVIVMVAPSINEEYYQEVFHEIIDYDIKAINTIYGKDDVVLLVDKATKHLFEGKIPDDAILEADVTDIWIRDFGTVDTKTEVKFEFKPQYLTIDDSAWINDSYNDWFATKNLSSKKSDLVLDGGNLVFNGENKAVTTVRIFEDNPQYSESEIDSMLKELLEVTEIAYLPEEEGDITGHSDGMVMWAESNKLLVNKYEEPFRSQVLFELEKSFSDIEIIEIPYVLHDELWRDWPSACGYYLNSLVTENYLYIPIYGLEEDQQVLNLIQSHTSKKVVSIDASNVCFMGGSVRCLTWTTDGINAEIILEN